MRKREEEEEEACMVIGEEKKGRQELNIYKQLSKALPLSL